MLCCIGLKKSVVRVHPAPAKFICPSSRIGICVRLRSEISEFESPLGYHFCSGRLAVNRRFDMAKTAGSNPARNTKVYASEANTVGRNGL